jgi:hypothetical protein
MGKGKTHENRFGKLEGVLRRLFWAEKIRKPDEEERLELGDWKVDDYYKSSMNYPLIIQRQTDLHESVGRLDSRVYNLRGDVLKLNGSVAVIKVIAWAELGLIGRILWLLLSY